MRLIAVNDCGLRVGESHPKARLTDHEVDLVRSLFFGGMSYLEIAKKFGVSKWSIARICRFERRTQVAVRLKKVG